ncbi:MAG: hypothetical protein KME45_10720 [Stenomitos rutilans HA7619-LM2]|nr:hypothetical protein [Stenomitos rutilans HA7619-LM2]
MTKALQVNKSALGDIFYAGLLFSVVIAFPIIAFSSSGKASAQTRPSPPVINPPLPSQQQPPIATLRPANGLVSVKLINKTGADIAYQVIGDTQVRTLTGRSTATLQALKTPVNVTFYRRDRGFLLVSPQVPTTAPNTIELTLTETTDFAIDKTALSIESDGEVYLN